MSGVCVADVPAYLRVASIAVAAYDWLWTLVDEYKIYRDQPSFLKMSRGCILFILIRYFSILAIVISNIGFFASFSKEGCHRFYLLSPAMKTLQAVVSQTILFTRTYAISRRATWVFWTISILSFVFVTLEFWSNLFMRSLSQNALQNCTSGNAAGFRVAWIHYLLVMIYDATCLGIATRYLCVQSSGMDGISGLSRLILQEGLLYFCFLAVVNIFNLILYRMGELSTQSAGATLGYAVTWIMSQRILIQLQRFETGSERARSHSRSHTDRGNTMAGGRTAPLNRNHGMSAHFAGPSFFDRSQGGIEEVGLGKEQATVEETVQRDYAPQSPALGHPEKEGDSEDVSVHNKSTNITRQDAQIAWDQDILLEEK